MGWIKDHFSSRYLVGLAAILAALIGITAVRFLSIYFMFDDGELVSNVGRIFQRYSVIEVASALVMTSVIGFVWFLIIRPISEGLGKQINELEINQVLLEEQNKIFVEQNQFLAHAIDISKEISSIRDLEALLDEAVNLIQTRYKLYYVQIYLVDQNMRTLSLKSGSGQIGSELRERGHRLLIGSGSINGTAAQTCETILVTDTYQSELFLANPLLPDTKAEMSIPLLVEQKLLGVLNLQSDRFQGLNRSIQNAIEGMAGQLAISIDNANRFIELEEAQDEIQERAKALVASGWRDFFNAVEKGDELNFSYQAKDAREGSLDTRFDTQPVLMASSILVSGTEIGSIQVENPPNKYVSEDDIELLRAISDQIGQKIENLRLLSDAQRYREQAETALRQQTRDTWEEYSQTKNDTSFKYDGVNLTKLGNDQIEKNGHLSKPLTVQGEPIGEVLVDNPVQDENTTDLISAVTESLSLHIENLRLTDQTVQRVNELSLLNDIGRLVATNLDIFSLTETVGERIRQSFNATTAFIATYQKEAETIFFPYFVITDADGYQRQDPFYQPFGVGLTSQVIQSREPILINHEEPGSFAAQGAVTVKDTNMPVSFLAAPMIAGDEVLGVISLQNTPDRIRFSENDKNLLSSIANNMAIALQNARLLQETQEALEVSESRRQELQAVNEVIGLTTTAATLQDSFDRMAGKLIQVLDMDLVTVSRLDNSATQLAIVAERDSLGPVNNRIGEFEKLRNMPAKKQVINTQKSILIEDVSNTKLLGVESKHLIETGASAILVLPLLGLSGVLGTVTLTLFGEERTFSEDQVRLAETIVYQTSTVIENKQLLAETHARALREQKVRTITDKIRSGSSREEIISIAKQEIATLIETSRQQKQS